MTIINRLLSLFRFPLRLGFRQQLVLAFSIGIICLALLSSFAISSLSRDTVREKLIEEGHRVSENFAAQSTLALLYHSADNAVDAAAATLAFPDIQTVALYDNERKPLFADGATDLLKQAPDNWPLTPQLEFDSKQAWYFIVPVFSHAQNADDNPNPFQVDVVKPELLGFVRVIMGKQTLQAMSSDILRGNLLVSSVLASLLLIVLLAITQRMTTPLKNLASFMQRAEQGETGLRAPIQGPRDVRDMEIAFNTMMVVLEAREVELKQTRDAALELAQIKGEFAANVSHELRTPLNAVLGMLELLQDMGLTPKQAEYVDIASNAGHSLLTLIGDILDFSKIEAGKLQLNIDDFNLPELLDDIMQLLAGQAALKELDMGYLIDPNVPSNLRAESNRIRQILINLIGNAIKFTAQGEIGFGVAIAGKGHETQLRFEVWDTGIGIPAAAQAHIFQAFSQVDSSTTRKYGGTGLGLAICQELAKIMGGAIGVESSPGAGSKFWFTVPLEKATTTPLNPARPPKSLLGLRLLLVDDSTITRAYLQQLLRSWGCEIESVADGYKAQALLHSAAAHNKPYDLVLADLSMPGINGDDLADLIAQDRDLKGCKVILLSNIQQAGNASASAPVVAARLAKPVRKTDLYDCITSALKKRDKGALLAFPNRKQAPRQLQDRTILVVEDNRANQQVAVGMLERLGCRSAVANDGREALNAIARERFDLILMDCQMPQMDGYETTRRIRAIEDGLAALPIIAMTANVREEDSEKCLAAGMDDYMAKPLQLGLLREKLQHWLNDDGMLPVAISSNEQRPLANKASANQAQPLDGKVFKELRDSLGEAFPRMIQAYVEDAPGYIDAMRSGLAADDKRKFLHAAHTLKGSSLSLGAKRLAKVCKQLEELGRADDLAAVDDMLPHLDNEYAQVKAALLHETEPSKELKQVKQARQARVLVVDDDRGTRIALRNIMEQDHYLVEEASNGAIALEICTRQLPDLIILDAAMPVMDGFSACIEIRQLPAAERTPVLIITALDDEYSIERAFEIGATDYIPKPVNFAVLRRRVERMIQASQAEEQVRQLAYYDSLTELPNRTYLLENAEALLARAQIEAHSIAVMFLDLDRFKFINDTLGHDVGDMLLKAVAERIRRCVRTKDLVIRLGGDEFTIILADIKSRNVVTTVADKICEALARPFTFMKQEMYITASIGIALFPTNGGDIGSLMKNADIAMFRAKETGNSHQFYDDAMEVVMQTHLKLERELRSALENDELLLHYQPQMKLSTNEIVSVEALIRWQHPDLGLLPPSEFIPQAEKSDLILALGDWTLRRACEQGQHWLQQGFGPVRIAINLSGRQLEDARFVDTVQTILDDTGFAAEQLEFEITESTLMNHAEEVLVILRKLKSKGISLAIDDFGTGYSSLSYLKRFPVDCLKIDRVFVHDSTSDSDGAAIIKSIIALGKSLQLQVVAEGVETSEQETLLRNEGCDLMQGFLLSKPLEAESLAQQFLHKTRQSQNGRVLSAKLVS